MDKSELKKDFQLAQFKLAVLRGEATWWQMNLPSGTVNFGEAKPQMLGYKPNDFETYQDFTELLPPDDKEKAMQAMKKHLGGRVRYTKRLTESNTKMDMI